MKAPPYPNPSADSLVQQCRALHAQSGRLLLHVSLIDAAQRDLPSIQGELDKLKVSLGKLEELLEQKSEAADALQLSLLS